MAEISEKASGFVADVSRMEDIASLMRHVSSLKGRIDVLFANADVARLGPIARMTEAVWNEVMGINLKGMYFTIQQALPLMTQGSAIVLNASLSAGKGVPDTSIYTASKAGVRSLGRSLGAELAGAVLFLASAEASYITGIELPVDGGAGSF